MEFMDEQERYLFGGIPRDFHPPIEALGDIALLLDKETQETDINE